MVANRRHISENNTHMSIMRNQLRIITINYIMDFGGEIKKFTKIIGKFHGSRKQKKVNHESQGK